MSRFFNGEADVWPGYAINEPLIADEQNVPVQLFRPQQFGIDLYAETLFTTGAQLKQKPDIVKKFVQEHVKDGTTLYYILKKHPI